MYSVFTETGQGSRLAQSDLRQQCRYIAKDSPKTAVRLGLQVFERVEALAQFPQRGRIGKAEDTRELVLTGTPWIAVYRVNQDKIFILRLINAAQHWPPAGSA